VNFPFAITNRKRVPKAVRIPGYKAFGVRSYYGDYLNDNLYKLIQDHVLGTEADVIAGDADVYYDGTNFRNSADGIVTFTAYDRIMLIMSALERSIVFPNVFLYLYTTAAVSLATFDITVPGIVDGQIDITGAAGTLIVSGVSNILTVTRTTATLSFTGKGTVIDNGVLM